MSRHKQLTLLYILPLAAVVISLTTHANTLGSILLFWGFPSLLLTIWAYNRALKAFYFAVISTIFLMAANITFYITHQWYVVSMFSHRIFGLMAWEDVPYFFFFVYFPIIFWEHFYERQVSEPAWSKKMTRLTSAFIIGALAFITGLFWAPRLIMIPYFYLIFTVLIGAIPVTLELLSHPRLRFKFLHTGIFFAYIGILYELTSLHLGQWYFPSDKFIGWIQITELRFPIEELFAWMLLGSSAILSWYEYFDNNQR
jgi:hypothetical protein